MKKQQIMIKKLANCNGLKLPSYATDKAAGMDLMAAIDQNIVLMPLERKMIPTGIAIALPDGYEAQIRPRSGLALKSGIGIVNAPGTIDADYRGEIGVILVNLSQEQFVIQRGMRIAQMVIAEYTTVLWNEVDNLSKTLRGSNGIGSTGSI